MTKNRTPTPVYLDPGMHPGLEVKGLNQDWVNVTCCPIRWRALAQRIPRHSYSKDPGFSFPDLRPGPDSQSELTSVPSLKISFFLDLLCESWLFNLLW